MRPRIFSICLFLVVYPLKAAPFCHSSNGDCLLWKVLKFVSSKLSSLIIFNTSESIPYFKIHFFKNNTSLDSGDDNSDYGKIFSLQMKITSLEESS